MICGLEFLGRCRPMVWGGAVGLAFCLGAANGVGLAPKDIIHKSVVVNEANYKAEPNYDYTEQDKSGGSSKTYSVRMIEGSPYNELIAVNGKPLSQDASAREKAKLNEAIAKRKAESKSERQQRIASYQRERNRDHQMMKQLTEAFDFQITGERNEAGCDVYVLHATPRSGYRPPNREARVLTGMRGELWIDKNSFQWVKVTAEVIHPVSIEGFLAKVEPGTKF